MGTTCTVSAILNVMNLSCNNVTLNMTSSLDVVLATEDFLFLTKQPVLLHLTIVWTGFAVIPSCTELSINSVVSHSNFEVE